LFRAAIVMPVAAAAALTAGAASASRTSGAAPAPISQQAATASSKLVVSPEWSQLKNHEYVTCTPHARIYNGAYRAINNAWLEPRECVGSFDGLELYLRSNATPGSTVVAYPNIRIGSFYADRDPQSGYPKPVSALGPGPFLHVGCSGKTTGTWICDTDAYFHPARDTNAHGTFELVIANRRSGTAIGKLIWVRGVPYRWRSWITCQRLANDSCDPPVKPWRIFVITRVHQFANTTIPVGSIARRAVRLGLLPRTDWLGDVAYGVELWSGGKGLHISMTAS